MLIREQSQSTLLWLIFLTTLSNTVTFGLAYSCSDHRKGTTNDSDFWFLCQQAATQILGLAIMCFPLWSKDGLPRLPWVAPAIAVLVLSLIAVPLYLYAPTEWSSFLILVGGAIQTFLVLQLGLLGA
jgi:cell division protein FtsW (lipid II flippase)